ncbi:MAG: PQQ-binding-like beta-propeller repeat protein [Thermoanaerobaculia bacterium]
MRGKVNRQLLAVAGALLLCIAALPAGAQNSDRSSTIIRRRTSRGPENDWTRYCASNAMNGVAVGEQVISSVTVLNLHLLWSQVLKGPIASQPSVALGKLYVGDWGGNEWAIDASTGDDIASIDLGQTTSNHCNPPVLGVTSSPAIVDNMIYVAGGDDAFYALKADDLSVVWRKSLGDNSETGGYYGWCSPAVAGGKVLQGISSNCDNPFPRGAIVGLDPATGVEVTSNYFVPKDRVGGGVWTSPAIDAEHGTIFVTTGSALAWEDGDAFSIVRLNLDTFAIEDRWKLPNDSGEYWDGDWGSSPTLFTDAKGRQLVGAGQKDGGYYVFDRNDLAAGPVWVAPIAIQGDVPQNGEGTLSTAAFDGKRLYVGGGIPRDNEDPAVMGAVSALDPGTGKILWRQTFAGPVLAPVSFANGVLFAVGGTTVAAFDAETGTLLWSFEMDAPGFGGIAIARGRAYVGDLAGNLYAFGVRAE